MDDRRIQFRVGVLVLSTIILTAILVVVLSGPAKLGLGTYTIYLSFQDAPGISVDTPVRKSGILIGRVTDVRFADDGTVLVTVAIQENIRLRADERPRISTGLLGDGVLEFYRPPDSSLQGDFSQPQSSLSTVHQANYAQADLSEDSPADIPQERFIKPGDVIVGDVVADPLQILGNIEGDLSTTIISVAQTSEDIGRLAREVTSLLSNNEEQFTRIIVKTETLIESLQSAAAGADSILGDPVMRENLTRSLNGLPVAIEDFHTLMGNLEVTLASADRNLNNLEQFTQPLGERGEQIIDRIDNTVTNLDVMLGEVGQFAKALRNPDGTLGQFLNNPDLYHNLNQAALDLDRLLKDARPVIYNTRVFTDTLAREGLRGQLKHRPPIK